MRPSRGSSRFLIASIPAALLCSILGGCPFLPPPTDTPKGDPALKPFNSASEMIGYFREQVQARNGVGFFGIDRSFDDGVAVLESTPNATADLAGGANDAAGGDGDGATFTSTNLQEVGVDESDVYKTDGRYIYVARSKSLFILDTKTEDGDANELRQVAQLELGQPVSSIYLRGDTIIALAQDYGYSNFGRPEILIYPPYYSSSTLSVYEIDVSDAADPQVAGKTEFDGSLVSSRILNDRLVLILNIVPEVPVSGNPISLATLELEAILPKVRMAGQAQNIAEWDEWLRPENPDGYNMTAVVTVDADDVQNIIRSVAVMANAGTIYSSTEALYITDTDYDAANAFKETTEIHKFAYGDDGGATYVASGAVRGRPLNQYSLGEYDGNLRIATHVQNFDVIAFDDVVGIAVDGPQVGATEPARAQSREEPTGPSNSIFVLGENAGKLDTLGAITGIAPGERIYSARFMGERGFLVTFEQIDPLFVLDLANANDPKIVGELKIPGFSDYLHIVGEDRLIGVGRATEIAPWGGIITAGMQISLFDVSDPTNPTAIQQLAVGGQGSQSDVSYNPKAFTLLQRDGKHIMALPASIWDYSNTDDFSPTGQFNGVITYDVDLANGFTERGRVSAVTDNTYGYVDWRRAMIIADQMFALSSGGVRSARLEDLSEMDAVAFPSIADEFPADGPIPVEGDGGAASNPGFEG